MLLPPLMLPPEQPNRRPVTPAPVGINTRENTIVYRKMQILLVCKMCLSGMFFVGTCFWERNFEPGGLVCFLCPETLITFGCMAFWKHTSQATVGPVTGVVLRIFWLLFFLTELLFWGWLTALLAFGGPGASSYQLVLIFMLLLPSFLALVISGYASLKIPLRPGIIAPMPRSPSPTDLSTTLPEESSQSGDWDQAKPGK